MFWMRGWLNLSMSYTRNISSQTTKFWHYCQGYWCYLTCKYLQTPAHTYTCFVFHGFVHFRCFWCINRCCPNLDYLRFIWNLVFQDFLFEQDSILYNEPSQISPFWSLFHLFWFFFFAFFNFIFVCLLLFYLLKTQKYYLQ